MVHARRNAQRLAAAWIAIGALAGALHGQAFEQWYVTPNVGTASQRCGMALSVQNGLMVVGAPYEDTKATDAGSVFIYRWDATANDWLLEQEIFASDAEASACFGWSVGVDTDVVVVGSPYKDTAKGADAGQIYVFRYDSTSKTWSQEQKLTSSVSAPSDYFGASIAISGNLVIAGSPRADTAGGTDSGAAFAFRYKNSLVKWVEEKELIDPDGAANDQAGTSVSVVGSTAVVGSPYSVEGSAYYAGSVGVWTVSGSTWTQVQELTASTPQNYAYFGTNVKLQNNQIGVCAPAEDHSTTVYDSGAVYLYDLVAGSWTLEQRFENATPTSYEYFGTDVAMAKNLVVVSAQNSTVSGKGAAGCAYTFRKGKVGGWVFDQQLGASDVAASDRFGFCVELNSDQILLTADGNDTAAGYDWGVIYGFDIHEISLSIDPPNPVPDETITFSAFRGTPGDVCMVTIEDVSGTHFFIPLLVYVFAADHTLTFTADAPNPAYGLHVGMRAYKISPTGPVVVSALTYVDV
jgi:hypothetical protein